MTEHKYEYAARRLRADLPAPGETLPSEAQLAQRYGVGLAAIRRGLQVLEIEGLITSGRGSLRMVRTTKRWHWAMTNQEDDLWDQNITEQGGRPSAEVKVELVPASEHVAQVLDVDQGTTIIARTRVRSVDGKPHQLSTSYLPQWVVADQPLFMEPGDQSDGLLAAGGHAQVTLKDEIGSRMPRPEEVRNLDISSITPLLEHHRTSYDADGRPVRHVESLMAADRVVLDYELDGA